MAAKENIIDRIDTLKANSVKEEQFRATWGMSLDEHMAKMMTFVQKTDVRIKEQRERHE
jgi:hypothetical protein